MADIYTAPTPSATFAGPVVIKNDNQSATSGNLTVANNLTVSGTQTNVGNVTQSGNLTIVSGLTVSGVATAISDTVMSGNLTVASIATLAQVGGGVVGTTAVSVTGGQTIAVTGRVSRITGTGATSVALATGTVDGQDLTLINLGVAVTISTNIRATYTLATTSSIGLVWDAGSTLWFHKV